MSFKIASMIDFGMSGSALMIFSILALTAAPALRAIGLEFVREVKGVASHFQKKLMDFFASLVKRISEGALSQMLRSMPHPIIR